MQDIIRARNLSKSFGSLTVLKSVDLTVKASEVLAIVGPSGAGKSTLLQLLGTLDKPSAAANSELIVLGNDLSKMTTKAMAHFRNQRLGFIFQFHELLPEFTALENVCLPAWIGKTDTQEAENSAIALLETLGLQDRIHHKPAELSGGEQQRVAVARALINQPDIIFADEPSGNLDSDNAQQLHQLFFELRDQLKCAFVIVTHNELLAEKADRTIFLQDGQIRA